MNIQAFHDKNQIYLHISKKCCTFAVKMQTICAISTAYGVGGIAIIRVSGERAIPIVDSLFVGRTTLSDTPANTVRHGRMERNGEVLDEVLCSVFRAPHSFTG